MKHVQVFCFLLATSAWCHATVVELKINEQLPTLLKQKSAAIVKFYLPACPGCINFAPKFVNLSNQYSSILFIAVNYDKHEALGRFYGITSVPFCIGFKDGKRIGDANGSVAKQVADLLNKLGNK